MPQRLVQSNEIVMRASMRPRRMRLGCRATPVVAADDVVASMRPRRMRLGCDPREDHQDFARSCFNEAEANAPRMRSLHTASMTMIQSFNEAEANAPRMQKMLATQNAACSKLQ